MQQTIPRLPVFDWNTFSGSKQSTTPCFLAHPGARYTMSGRASILLALEMLKMGPGDKVLVPTYHCPTMIAPIGALGAQAVFYPVNSHGGPDLHWMEQHQTQDIRAILVAHFFGLPQPLAHIRKWCDQQNVCLIEDCAHSLFGMSGERDVGRWGDLAIASLTKFLPVPEGGCVVENRIFDSFPQLHKPSLKNQIKAGYDVLHAGVNHGRLAGLGPFIHGANKLRRWIKKESADQSASRTQPSEFSSDGSAIDISHAHSKLTATSRWIAQNAHRARIVDGRRSNFIFFMQAFSGVAGMHPLFENLPDQCAPYIFPLWVDQPDPGYSELRRLNFPVSRWDRLWPTVAHIECDFGIKWSHHVLQLACHQDLTLAELQHMVSILKEIYMLNSSHKD